MESLGTSEVFASWVGRLLRAFLLAQLRRAGTRHPSEADLERAFAALWPECSAKLMVQEPWMGTIRFKGLARFCSQEFGPMVVDPVGYLTERFGGGKFKVNFYRGMNFVATQNFKPAGEPKWKALPELQEE
jgi:hypothetical protein